MSIGNQIGADGLRESLIVDGETAAISVTIGGAERNVAALIDRQPYALDMQDAGYLARKPATVQCLKGTPSSTAFVMVDEVLVSEDLRGLTPKMRGSATIDGESRRIEDLHDGGTFWTITTLLRI